ncbi:MAG: POTRA domain-containing protein [Planctomycetota bacterium]
MNDALPRRLLATTLLAVICVPAAAQFGSPGMGGGGQPGGGPQPQGTPDKPKFRDVIHQDRGFAVNRESGDAIVAGVRVKGNRSVETHTIMQQLKTKSGRFYDVETVFADIRRLTDLRKFDNVTYEAIPSEKGMFVTFIVRERPIVSELYFHGAQHMNRTELQGRAGIGPGDPISEFAIENARRRLIDYYREEGFNQVSIKTEVGAKKVDVDGGQEDPFAVVFRINEGPLERIEAIHVEGSTVVSEARLKKIISSRGSPLGVVHYLGNVASIDKINADVDALAAYYHNLGYLTATVGRRIEYDRSGKWMTVTFVVNEGPQFTINEVRIIGNRYVETDTLMQRLELQAGQPFNGTKLRRDVGEMTYGYGELGFIYAEIEPQTVMRDEANIVDLVYKIDEGDRWKIGEIKVNIEGDPHLMKEQTILNMLSLRPGDLIDRRDLEIARRRLSGSNLLEVNPAIADPPDITVVPKDDPLR